MNIGIDIDDTISDTYTYFFNYAQEYTINDLKRSASINRDIKCFTHLYCAKMHSWSEDEEKDFISIISWGNGIFPFSWMWWK